MSCNCRLFSSSVSRFFSCNQLAKTGFFLTFGAFAAANSVLCFLSEKQDAAIISLAAAIVAFGCTLMVGCDAQDHRSDEVDRSGRPRLL